MMMTSDRNEQATQGGIRTERASNARQRRELEADLREFFSREEAEWQEDADLLDLDLWDTMPTVDSKAVARTSHIFKKWLGKPLDVRLIREGGYENLDDMIQDLVPKMLDR